jgi:osmoprotectant transport system substrate-binding protein
MVRRPRRAAVAIAASLVAVLVVGCGGGSGGDGTSATSTATSSGAGRAGATEPKPALPGSGKPLVTIGDKNVPEQFILGELYYQALEAQGFKILLSRNIGPTEVTLPALQSGRLAMYPEYLQIWDTTVAGYRHTFPTAFRAYQAGQRYALRHGLELLNPTPFANSDEIGVTFGYADEHRLRSLHDLRRVATTMTMGGPPQFAQEPDLLPALEQAYGFVPASYKSLEVGASYQALDKGTVQAADVHTTDPQLQTGDYRILRDPRRVLGWGNVVPVASAKLLQIEGPVFAATIDKVSALLTLTAIRQLNGEVEISHKDPAAVARAFLTAHGLLRAPAAAG